jgi:hypothetical protein
LGRLSTLSPKAYRDLDEDELATIHQSSGNAVLQRANQLTAQNFPSEAIADLIPRTDDGRIFFSTLAEMRRRGRKFDGLDTPQMMREIGELANFPFAELEAVVDPMAGDEWDGLNPGDDGVY